MGHTRNKRQSLGQLSFLVFIVGAVPHEIDAPAGRALRVQRARCCPALESSHAKETRQVEVRWEHGDGEGIC